jgi:DNA-binding NarL/FixJ family response regulator
MSGPSNKGNPWTTEEIAKLRALAGQGLSTPEIARRMKRTESAIRTVAAKHGITLKPNDK